MLVLLHVIVALTSVCYAGYAFIRPSRKNLRFSYGLVTLTLASGTYLVISMNANMISACLTGLIYLGIVFSAIAGANYKLARQSTNKQ